MLHAASVVSPLIGAIIAGFFGRALGDRAAAIITCVFMAIAMLACARLGAIHSVVFGGFAAPSLAARIDGLCWPVPPVFTWLSTAGEVAVSEMLRTFNCGIGMVVIADAARAEALKAVLRDAGERAHVMGYVERRSGEAPPVTVVGAEATWPA